MISISVNHEIPKCKKCHRFMTLRNTEEATIIEKRLVKDPDAMNYIYYCDNLDCSNNKTVKKLEYKR